MKKVLISMLLVLLTLCLFVSCSNEPKVKKEPTTPTKTIKLYLNEVSGQPDYTLEIPDVEKWSDLDWDVNDEYEVGNVLFQKGKMGDLSFIDGYNYFVKTPLSEYVLINDNIGEIYILSLG